MREYTFDQKSALILAPFLACTYVVVCFSVGFVYKVVQSFLFIRAEVLFGFILHRKKSAVCALADAVLHSWPWQSAWW